MNGDVTAGYIMLDIERLRKPMQMITDHLSTNPVGSILEHTDKITSLRKIGTIAKFATVQPSKSVCAKFARTDFLKVNHLFGICKMKNLF